MLILILQLWKKGFRDRWGVGCLLIIDDGMGGGGSCRLEGVSYYWLVVSRKTDEKGVT